MSRPPSRFEFTSRSYEPSSGEIRLQYRLGDQDLTERFVLPIKGSPDFGFTEAIEHALDALHWIAGVSYWKAYCPGEITFSTRGPDEWQAAALHTIYLEGLREFAWHNQIDLSDRLAFKAVGEGCPSELSAPTLGLTGGALVPLGGGKDSVVAWHRLYDQLGPDQLMSVQVGSSPLIQALGDWMVQEHLTSQHWTIKRSLDPMLGELNQAGAMNGHVPITAINAAVLSVFALLLGVPWVVFANERSADEPTLIDAHGHSVNHQFSKSFVFECLFDDWIKRYVAADLAVFSLLRQDRELAITQDFAELRAFHQHCSSCNRHFHLDPQKRQKALWCGQCPKCHFVYLAMALSLSPDEMVQIFGSDLLADPDNIAGFEALMALDGKKPFECVGEVAEARAAMMALSRSPMWSSHVVVTNVSKALVDFPLPSISELLRPSGSHRIPSALRP